MRCVRTCYGCGLTAHIEESVVANETGRDYFSARFCPRCGSQNVKTL